MLRKTETMQLRLKPLCCREFQADVYRPGVISLARLIWGSIGAGLLLLLIAVLSKLTGISVLFPPLAATCFIVANCSYLRVARPKQVIVSHFAASICGLAGARAGEWAASGTDYTVAVQLGLAVGLATLAMQLFDADHPPAAATAAIPAILPLPMPEYLLPVYMAWGATLAVLFALAWNRIWFDYPTKDVDHHNRYYGLYMEKVQLWGVMICAVSFVLMCFQGISLIAHAVGLMSMVIGVSVLGLHHFLDCILGTSQDETNFL